jgi:hypothetical protein
LSRGYACGRDEAINEQHIRAAERAAYAAALIARIIEMKQYTSSRKNIRATAVTSSSSSDSSDSRDELAAIVEMKR